MLCNYTLAGFVIFSLSQLPTRVVIRPATIYVGGASDDKQVIHKDRSFHTVLISLAYAKDKDHSAEYQAGTFSSTGQISDGGYASCSGGG